MIEERLKELGIILPEAPARGGNYTPVKYFSDDRLVYCSGFGSTTPDWKVTGKVGKAVTKEQGYEGARNCMLNLLAAFKRDIGSLDEIQSFVKMLALRRKMISSSSRLWRMGQRICWQRSSERRLGCRQDRLSV